MASVNFNLFKTLWEEVKEKFANEHRESFTLENLNRRGVTLKLADWNKINRKLEQDEVPKDINLSASTYTALYKYLGIKQLTDLDAISEDIERPDKKAEVIAIGFLGRKDELNELNNFLVTPECRILELYGVPMIGKTELINYFLENDQTAKGYKIITVKLNPQPEDAGLKLKNIIFEDRDLNDFSGFSSNTLVVIQNFEEALRWTGNPEELHDIEDKYSDIKAFLKEVTEVGTIKLIIESRFQINFLSLLSKVRPLVRTLEIEGVDREEFWKFYRSRGFSHEGFEKLCNKFGNHTWLLSLSYNNDDFIYQGRLIDAVYRPNFTTIYLWGYVQDIVNRLEVHEILSLCALTFLKEPIALENLYSYLISPDAFKNRLEIDESLRSLEKKLLVQVNREFYELNPYIREVCFTFLSETRKREMQIIKSLPFIRIHGESPIYNQTRQAQERGDYKTFFRLIKEARREGHYTQVHDDLEAALYNPQFKKKIVLNEIGITYKMEGNLDKAIETFNTLATEHKHVPALNELAIFYRDKNQLDKAIGMLEKAEKIDPNDTKTLNELAICYQVNGDYAKSIKVAEKAIRLGHYRCYTVLANTYQRMGDLKKAYQIAENGVKATARQDERLIEQLRELEGLMNQQAKDGHNAKPLKVFISYSHQDEKMKERLDTFLATLKREGKVETWSDRRISPGGKLDNTIATELELADIILLLISQDFIQSEYIWKIELPRALERHERGEAVVIPIFCHAIDDFGEMPFAKLNGLPKDAVPINSPDNNSALSEVAKGIRKIAVTLLEKRSH
jgi:tetratricopeptide (TPR) repeat protein